MDDKIQQPDATTLIAIRRIYVEYINRLVMYPSCNLKLICCYLISNYPVYCQTYEQIIACYYKHLGYKKDNFKYSSPLNFRSSLHKHDGYEYKDLAQRDDNPCGMSMHCTEHQNAISFYIKLRNEPWQDTGGLLLPVYIYYAPKSPNIDISHLYPKLLCDCESDN